MASIDAERGQGLRLAKEYSWTRQPNGKFTIFSVEVFAPVEAGDKDQLDFAIDENWMEGAVKKFQAKAARGVYPVVHIGHQEDGGTKNQPNVGFLNGLRIEYDDDGPKMYADMVEVKPKVFQAIRDLTFPNRSVELLPPHDEISSLALLQSREAHFPFPMLAPEGKPATFFQSQKIKFRRAPVTLRGSLAVTFSKTWAKFQGDKSMGKNKTIKYQFPGELESMGTGSSLIVGQMYNSAMRQKQEGADVISARQNLEREFSGQGGTNESKAMLIETALQKAGYPVSGKDDYAREGSERSMKYQDEEEEEFPGDVPMDEGPDMEEPMEEEPMEEEPMEEGDDKISEIHAMLQNLMEYLEGDEEEDTYMEEGLADPVSRVMQKNTKKGDSMQFAKEVEGLKKQVESLHRQNKKQAANMARENELAQLKSEINQVSRAGHDIDVVATFQRARRYHQKGGIGAARLFLEEVVALSSPPEDHPAVTFARGSGRDTPNWLKEYAGASEETKGLVCKAYQDWNDTVSELGENCDMVQRFGTVEKFAKAAVGSAKLFQKM